MSAAVLFHSFVEVHQRKPARCGVRVLVFTVSHEELHLFPSLRRTQLALSFQTVPAEGGGAWSRDRKKRRDVH